MAAKLILLVLGALSLAACSSSRVTTPDGDTFIRQLDSLQVIALDMEATEEKDTTQIYYAWAEVVVQAASPPQAPSDAQREKACSYARLALSRLNALALRPRRTSDGLNIRGTDIHYYLDGELVWPTIRMSERVQTALECRFAHENVESG